MKTSHLTAVSLTLSVRAQTVPSTSSSSTTSSTIDCDSAWGSLEANLPTPPPSLSDAWNKAHISNREVVYFTALSEICSFASANIDRDDTSLSAVYSTFNLQYYSWYLASSEPWKSLVTECPSTAVYGPIEQQTSELNGVLTAYSKFEVGGCDSTMATATTTTTTTTQEGTAASTSSPTFVTVNSGRREKSTAVGLITAAFVAVWIMQALGL